jgi:preflagellin peptidase FlaK
MIEIFFVTIAIVGAVIASITDVKKGIIPNRLTFPLIAVGVSGYLVYSLYTKSLAPFAICIKSVAIIFVIGYLFWMLGGWSAGDVKEFLFLAALLPQYPIFLKGIFNPYIAPYSFIITVFINTFLVIFPFIVIYSIYISYPKLSLSKFLEPVKHIDKYAKSAFIVVGCISLAMLLGIRIIAIIALLSFSILRIKESYKLIASAIFIAVFWVSWVSVEPEYALGVTIFLVESFLLLTLIFLFVFGIFWNSLKILREALCDEIKISDLEEGMIVAEEIYKKNDRIFRDDRGVVEKIIASIKSKDVKLLLQKRDMVVGTSAAGISDEGIATLKRYVEDGRLEDRIKVKRRMPFAIVIFFGLIVSLIYGDVITGVKGWLYG